MTAYLHPAKAASRLLGLVRASLLLITFASSAVFGLVLHANLPAGRRAVRSLAERALSQAFEGRMTLGAITDLTATSVSLAGFSVAAPDGTEVLSLVDVRLHGGWVRNLLRVAASRTDTLSLSHVRIEHARLSLSKGADGMLTLARAFQPRRAPPPTEPAPEEPAGGGGLTIEQIEVAAIHVTGMLGEAVPVEAHISRLGATLKANREGLSLDVARSSLRDEHILGAPTTGTFELHARVRRIVRLAASGGALPATVWGSFGGHVGSLPLTAHAQYDEGRIAVALDLPRVGPRELQPWLPAGPLTTEIAASASFYGAPPLYRLAGKVWLPPLSGGSPGSIVMDGQLRLDGQSVGGGIVDVTLLVAGLNARVLGTELPVTSLSSRARVQGKLAGSDTELVMLFDSYDSSIASEHLPPISGSVMLAQAGIDAALALDEPGLELDASVSAAGGKVTFALRAAADELARVPRLAAWLEGASGGRSPRGALRIAAAGTLGMDQIDARARLDFDQVRWPEPRASLHTARIDARIHGPRSDLQLTASGAAAGLEVGGYHVDRAVLSASGRLDRPAVTVEMDDAMGRTVRASGELDPRRREARGLRFSVARGDTRLLAEIARARSLPGRGVELGGMSLRGSDGTAGSGSLTVLDGELVGKLRATDVDLATLSRLLGLDHRLEGRADVDVDLGKDARGRHGHVALTVRKGGRLMVRGVELDARVELEGSRVRPSATIAMVLDPGARDAGPAMKGPCDGRVGELAIESADGEIDGPLLSARSWQRFIGRGRLVLRDVKLACANELLLMPLERLEGVVNASAELERSLPDALPSVRGMVLRTTGLAVAPRRREGNALPHWVSDRVDLALTGSVDGTQGDIALDVLTIDTRATTAAGAVLARIHGSTRLDLEAWRRGTDSGRESIESAPLDLRFETDRRPLAGWRSLPEPLRSKLAELERAVSGDVEIDAFLEGTLAQPSIGVRARAWEIAPRDDAARRRPRAPIDVDVLANYHAAEGRLDGSVSQAGRRLATLTGTLTGDVPKWLANADDARLTGTLSARFRAVPLQLLPPLSQRRVSGRLDGNVALLGLGGPQPELTTDLTLSKVAMGRDVVLERAHVRIVPVPGRPGVMTLESQMLTRGGGSLTVAAYGSVLYTRGVVPGPDDARPAALYVRADRLPLHIFTPVLPSEQVANLDGMVNGALRVSYKEVPDRDVAIDSDMTISNGVVALPSLGQEYYNVGARIRSAPNVLIVDDISAMAESGMVTGKVTARFDGLDFADLTGSFHVAEDQPMPVTLRGASMGTASVRTLLVNAAKKRGDETDVTVTIDGLRVKLPSAASRALQGLDDHPDVTISHLLSKPDDDASQDGPRANITLSMRDAEIEGNNVRIAFATKDGRPLRVSRGRRNVSGELTLQGGELVLLSKVFEVDRGFVRMRPDAPGNPYVSLTAHWTAPDGSTVFVDYVGPLRPISSDKLTFRSNPPRPQNELIALVLFGDVESGARVGSVTASRRGEIAAEQLSVPLGELAPGLTTSVSRGRDGGSTSLVYQLSDRVTARATLERQDQAAADARATGDEPKSARSTSRTRISLDYRFAPSWLLRGTFSLGDQPASGVDVLYQHRYE